MNDVNFLVLASDTVTETLWPIAEWNAILVDSTTKSEAKLTALIAKQTTTTLAVANFVFTKPNNQLCSPKKPDFVLVDKEFEDVPTPKNVGASDRDIVFIRMLQTFQYWRALREFPRLL